MAEPENAINNPNLQGFSEASLQALTKIVHDSIDEKIHAGAVTLIARHGSIVLFDAYGPMDLSHSSPVPVKKDSIFRMASMTKPIIGVAMMMLWEEKKWALEDLVEKHIPEFTGLKVLEKDGTLVEQLSPMTMKQLMTHNAGFGATSEYLKDHLRGGALQDMIDTLSQKPLPCQPGAEFRYGPSVDIQGYVIEKLSGQGLDEFLEQRLFVPLGMKDTGFWVDPSKGNRVARLHKIDENGNLVPASGHNTFPKAKPKYLSGGGGLLGTIEDYWRFCQLCLNDGQFEGRRYLEASTMKMTHTNMLPPGVHVTVGSRVNTGLGFGLGFSEVLDADAAQTNQPVGCYSWAGLYGTWFWIDPVNDLIAIGCIQHQLNYSDFRPHKAPLVVAKALYASLDEKAQGQF